MESSSVVHRRQAVRLGVPLAVTWRKRALLYNLGHLLAAQEMPARNEQIWSARTYDQAVGVLRQSAIEHLDEAEHPLMTPIECSTLARTFDLVRFFARSTSSTTPRWR